MQQFLKMLTLGGAICLGGMPSYADEVTLRTANNSVQISGELLSFDGEKYTLKTSVGEFSLAAEGLICTGAACPADTPDLSFTVSGVQGASDGVFPALLAAFAQSGNAELGTSETEQGNEYATRYEGEEARINVMTRSSAQAYEDLIAGRSALALVNRVATQQEIQQMRTAGIEAVKEHTLAIGGLTIVTSKDNALASLSIDDVGRIFSGEITNWSEIDGPDATIKLYGHAPGAGIKDAFEALVLDPAQREISAAVSELGNDAQVAQAVAADSFGIGYTGFLKTPIARQTPIIGKCGLVVTPSEFNIRAEEYPLSYRMRAVTTGQRQSALLEQMLTFAPTNEAQVAVASSGTIDQILTSSAVDQQGMRFASALQSETVVEAIPRLQAMVSEMVKSERVSATFRFEAGSRTLDERGFRDIERVAQLLQKETAQGALKTVRVMGFTDSLGHPELNAELSKRRAQQVTDAILTQAPELAQTVTFLPMGFGEISPIGCDQSTKGRWINRRVEIWISAAAK